MCDVNVMGWELGMGVVTYVWNGGFFGDERWKIVIGFEREKSTIVEMRGFFEEMISYRTKVAVQLYILWTRRNLQYNHCLGLCSRDNTKYTFPRNLCPH